jgi:hypothetical protein
MQWTCASRGERERVSVCTFCNGSSIHNQVKAGGCGAIEAVVAALRAHPSSAAVQENGCSALINLAANANNQVKAGGCGAIEAVVAAMKRHLSNAKAQ